MGPRLALVLHLLGLVCCLCASAGITLGHKTGQPGPPFEPRRGPTSRLNTELSNTEGPLTSNTSNGTGAPRATAANAAAVAKGASGGEEPLRRGSFKFPDYERQDDTAFVHKETSYSELPDFLDASPAGQEGSHAELAPGSRRMLHGSMFSLCHVWVSPDGAGGSFKSIQKAIDSFGHTNRVRRYICLKPGEYNEQVHVKTGQNAITLIGSGRQTIIHASNSQSTIGSPYYSATLIVEGNRFIAMALIVANTHFSVWDPAPAVALISTDSQWYTVGIKGWMDTLAIFDGRHYFQSCYVEGKTDFIWGFGRAYFYKCQIFDKFVYSYIGYITAAGVDLAQAGPTPGGFIFYKCTISGNGHCYLGRPYRRQAFVAMISSYLGSNILPQGWSDWQGRFESGEVTFLEVNNRGPGSQTRHRQLARIARFASLPVQYSANGWVGLWQYQLRV